jgi:hypothetical protein
MTRAMNHANNTWYEHNDHHVVLVFVHGVLSDSESCWTAKDCTFWPWLILNDVRFGRPSIFLGGYHSKLADGRYDINDCAKELYDALTRRDEHGGFPLQGKAPLFICHSTGGLVVREMLRQRSWEFQATPVGLALIASPSRGSSWANLLGPLVRFYEHAQVRALQQGDLELELLHRDFAELVRPPRPRLPLLIGREASENHMILRSGLPPWIARLLPNRLVVVARSSNEQYFGEPRMLRGTDHFSAVKPTTAQDPGHEFLLDFYRVFLDHIQRASASGQGVDLWSRSHVSFVPPDAVDLAERDLASSEAETRKRGLSALRQMDTDRSLGALKRALRSPYPDVRRDAALLAIRRGDTSGAAHLAQSTPDDRKLWGEIREALNAAPPGSVQDMLVALGTRAPRPVLEYLQEVRLLLPLSTIHTSMETRSSSSSAR